MVFRLTPVPPHLDLLDSTLLMLYYKQYVFVYIIGVFPVLMKLNSQQSQLRIWELSARPELGQTSDFLCRYGDFWPENWYCLSQNAKAVGIKQEHTMVYLYIVVCCNT